MKESYFPTWRAYGADGPYRLAPNMMVVIPTARTVTMRVERDTAGTAGLALTAMGLLLFTVLAVRTRRGAHAWPWGRTPSTGGRLRG